MGHFGKKGSKSGTPIQFDEKEINHFKLYQKDKNMIMSRICQQFLTLKEINGSKSLSNAYLDINLSLNILNIKMSHIGSLQNMDSLINFSLNILECARVAATFDEDADLKGEIKYLQSQLDDVKGSLSRIERKIG